uniref:Uncharacterized protein n=1 Tax=Acrobeloides nanus TaxID=290746 RepID=A0A914DVB9_9BILA
MQARIEHNLPKASSNPNNFKQFCSDACPCNDVGIKFFWKPSNNLLAHVDYDYWKNNTPRYTQVINGMVHYKTFKQAYDWDKTRYAAFVLESGYNNFCQDICICSIENKCFTFSSPYGYVELVPYCEDNECYMYALTYRNDSIPAGFGQSNLYGLLQDEDGNVYDFPAPFNASLGKFIPLLPTYGLVLAYV